MRGFIWILLVIAIVVSIGVIVAFPIGQGTPRQVILPPLNGKFSNLSYIITNGDFNLTIHLQETNAINRTVEIYWIDMQVVRFDNYSLPILHKGLNYTRTLLPSQTIEINSWMLVPTYYSPGMLSVIVYTNYGQIAEANLLPFVG